MKSLALSLLALTAIPALAANDIAGIEIGRPLAEQREAIAKINPAYQLSEIKSGRGQITGVQAVARRNGRVTDDFVALQDASGIVWFIGRALALEKNQRIKRDALFDSWVKQYGGYTDLTAGAPHWQFDRAGKLYQGTPINGPCYAGFGHGVMPVGHKVTGFAAGMAAPKTFSPRCGVEIRTAVRRAAGATVAAYSVRIIDAQRRYDQVHGPAAAKK